jgi:hypothetical protein
MDLRALCQSAICSRTIVSVGARIESERELRVRVGFFDDARRCDAIDDIALVVESSSSMSSGALRWYVTKVEAVVNEELGDVAREIEVAGNAR